MMASALSNVFVTNSQDHSLKRKREQEEFVQKKKRRVENAPMCSAYVMHEKSTELAEHNIAFLSPTLFSTLFDGDSSTEKLVKISGWIFYAIKEDSFKKSVFKVSTFHYKHFSSIIKGKKGEKVFVSAFDPEKNEVAFLKTLHLEVKLCSPKLIEAPLYIDQRSFIEMLPQCILGANQVLRLNHPEIGPLKFKVKSWKNEQGKKGSFGKLTEQTDCVISSLNPLDLIICERFCGNVERFYFEVKNIRYTNQKMLDFSGKISKLEWATSGRVLPLHIEEFWISKKLVKQFSGKMVPLGVVHTVRYHDYQCDLQLMNVDVKSLIKGKDLSEEINYLFSFKEESTIAIHPNQNLLITQNVAEARVPEKVTFEIIDVYGDNCTVFWASEELLTKVIRENAPILPLKGKYVVDAGKIKFLLNLVKVTFEESSVHDDLKGVVKTWRITDETELFFSVNSGLNLGLVDSSKPKKIESAIVLVKMASEAFFERILLETENIEKTSFKEEELLKVFLESFKLTHRFKKGDQVDAITDLGISLLFEISGIKTLDKVPSRYPSLYRFTKKSSIKFNIDPDVPIAISAVPVQLDDRNFHARFEELGIGGVSESFKRKLKDIILERVQYRDHSNKKGITPCRGFILHGPPGTGKTLCARKIGELLGVSEENTKMLSASTIHSKYVGESEGKIRKLFADARENPGKDYLIILDEIDALSKRSGDAKTWEQSTMNALIAEIDGIGANGKDSPNNVVVVGLTNFFNRLDEALIRPGRLYPHFQIRLPNAKGRQEIFAIHTRPFADARSLADDIDWNLLVEKTRGKSGAFIAEAVSLAFKYSLRRLSDHHIPAEDAEDAEESILSTEDFLEAIKELSSIQKMDVDEKEFVPSEELTEEAIIQDLERLGLAGVPSEVVRYLLDIKLQQNYSEVFRILPEKSPQGVLFYGEKGVGKTALGKAMKQLFALDDSRYTYLQLSQIWDKSGSAFKEEIALSIEEARQITLDDQEQTPLSILVVDELDTLLTKEDLMSGQSPIQMFMKELQPLFSRGEKRLSDFLVVGIASTGPIGFADDVIKNGPFGRHIEISVPRKTEIQSMFRLYLQPYVKEGMLAPEMLDQDFSEFAHQPSGAFVKGMVQEAVAHAVRRFASGSERQILWEDFEAAAEKMHKKKPYQDYFL